MAYFDVGGIPPLAINDLIRNQLLQSTTQAASACSDRTTHQNFKDILHQVWLALGGVTLFNNSVLTPLRGWVETRTIEEQAPAPPKQHAQ